MNSMIAIGCDHGGLDIKNAVIAYLTENGFEKHENQRLNDRISGVTLWR